MTSRIAFLATGNELTEGDIVNTNSQIMAKALAEQSFNLGFHMMVSDEEADIKEGLTFLLEHHSVVIITGGLGPTSDDRTRYALSAVLKRELIFDDGSWQSICERHQKRFGHDPHPANRQQALFPKNAEILYNENGSAPGCKVVDNNKIIYMLPGPPRECIAMFNELVLPDLLSKATHSKRIKLSWMLESAIEAEIAALVDEAIKNYPATTTGYRAASPYLEVKIYTYHHPQYDEMVKAVEKIISPLLAKK